MVVDREGACGLVHFCTRRTRPTPKRSLFQSAARCASITEFFSPAAMVPYLPKARISLVLHALALGRDRTSSDSPIALALDALR